VVHRAGDVHEGLAGGTDEFAVLGEVNFAADITEYYAD
jgi:mannose/fructose/N-acetylgalactosamine-specific phosphotransferase system component IIC